MDNRKPRIHEIDAIAGDVGYLGYGKFSRGAESIAEYSERTESGHGYTLRTLVDGIIQHPSPVPIFLPIVG